MPYGEVGLSAVATAGGTATITIRSGRQRWTVSQVSTEMINAPSGSTCVMRKNGNIITTLVANGDVAGGDPPIEIGPGDSLTVVWSSVTPGQVGKATVIYDDGTVR